jgi:hypothetical protein
LTVEEHDQATQRRSLLDGFQRHYEELLRFPRQQLWGQDIASDVLQDIYLSRKTPVRGDPAVCC